MPNLSLTPLPTGGPAAQGIKLGFVPGFVLGSFASQASKS
jgi:hypothetical protein